MSDRLAVFGVSLFFAAAASGADFVDVTSGPLGDPGVGETVIWGDYDGDGDHDLYITNKLGSNRLLRNEGDGSFSDATSGPEGDPDDGEGAAWGDFDDDGDLDLYLANTSGAPNRLFRNDGAAGFSDATSGPLGDTTNGEGVAWADYDRDGDLDLYVVNFGGNKLFRNDGNGVFKNATAAAGLGDQGIGRSLAWGDYDDDGDLDLYVTNGLQTNRMFRNDGGTFADATSGPLANDGSGQGVAWGDYDRDGDLDLYLGIFNATNELLRNDGGGSFTDVTSGPLGDGGVTLGVAWGDYDNDADLDLYVVNDGANRLLRNDGAAFVDVTSGPLGNVENGRGTAWCDYDGDGDLDLYLVNMGTASRLFRNDLANGNRWIQIDLEGTATNRAAIGARVRVVAGGVAQILEICGGSGYHSQNSLTAEFGLGAAAIVDTLQVRWTNGLVETRTKVAVDQRISILENPPTPVPPGEVPSAMAFLHPARPNPFRDRTTIRLELAEATHVDLGLYDVAGRRIVTLVDSKRASGAHSFVWTGEVAGRSAPPGTYFLRMKAGGVERTRKVIRAGS